MKEEMDIEDFERFLKRQTDKYRMYPSSRLWRNINQQLHGNSRWPALTFAAILTGALLMAILVFFHPNKSTFKLSYTEAANAKHDSIAFNNKAISSLTDAFNMTILKPAVNNAAIYSFNDSNAIADPLSIDRLPMVHVAVNEMISLNDPILNNDAVLEYKQEAEKGISIGNNESVEKDIQLSTVFSDQESNDSKGNMLSEEINKKLPTDTVEEKYMLKQPTATTINIENHEQAGPEKLYKKNMLDRIRIHIYGGSSVSYRFLSEPESHNVHFPYNSALTSNPRSGINNFVKQRPSIGFEVGTALSYILNSSLSIKAGLQFNYRQYNSNAHYTSTAEQAILLLNNSDSFFTHSNLRNDFDYKQSILHNSYFQIALPIAFDWTFAEGRKVKFSFGASFQPTYQLNKNLYMITSDYKSYTQQPNLVRRWNFNTSAEFMANFKMGNLQWQVGPQVRYQMLPTHIKSYSIHEHLIDYGFKLGVIKRLK